MDKTESEEERKAEAGNILLAPASLGPYSLPNHMVMAPLTRNRAGEGNVPQPMNVAYYEQRASAGLIITEASQISPQGVGYPGTPGIHSADQIRGWKQVVDAVHQKGGHIFLQLWHVGRISHPSLQQEDARPVAPSAIKPAGEAVTCEGMQPFVTPRALSTGEIPGIIDQYYQAAKNALEAGFDGVEIHAANGYLLDQFLRDSTNQRTDVYGGALKNRARLLLEVTEAVTGVWGADRVGVRISPVNTFNDISDSNPQVTFIYVAQQLNQFHIAYLHVVEGVIGGGPEGQAFDTTNLRQQFKGLYMANAGYDYDRATRVLADKQADLVSFGKLYIANPDLPERFARHAELNTPDESTFYGGDEKGYTDYPFLDNQNC